jgi:hypothetical protein
MMLVHDGGRIGVFIHRQDCRRTAVVGPQKHLAMGLASTEGIGPPQDWIGRQRQLPSLCVLGPGLVRGGSLLGLGLELFGRVGLGTGSRRVLSGGPSRARQERNSNPQWTSAEP